ncbi:DUF4136 domain-containing protein [Xylophilus rhododendri]|uniref:DUF4136 domain-containing protein n=1 Tax=Xylophilus rhododendri TaxID=2697032 RepID=A0A857JAS3_9BURK|nr:DUF4136 domain-containing protein [Xylophilus rhododendri]QHJ01115.1 DUF4136 domain-containing protein [Xylophilus rhododendri]
MPALRTLRRLAALLAAASALALAGCASYIETKVTNFNAWPADAAGASYSFGARPAGSSELEQSTYEQYVSEQLQRLGLGLKPAAPGQKGRLLVDVAASGSQRTVRSLQPVYQNYRVFVPSRPGPNGTVLPGYWTQDMYGGQYVGDREVARTLQVSRLKVQIHDQGRSVYESTAVYEGGLENLPDMVVYLARAAFDDFPGRNAETRVVRFDTPAANQLQNAEPARTPPATAR